MGPQWGLSGASMGPQLGQHGLCWRAMANHGWQAQDRQWLSATAWPVQSAWLAGPACLAARELCGGGLRGHDGSVGFLGSAEMKKARAFDKVRAFWVFCGQSGYACSLSDRILITWQLLGLRWSQLELALQPEHPLEHRPQRRLGGQLQQDHELR